MTNSQTFYCAWHPTEKFLPYETAHEDDDWCWILLQEAVPLTPKAKNMKEAVERLKSQGWQIKQVTILDSQKPDFKTMRELFGNLSAGQRNDLLNGYCEDCLEEKEKVCNCGNEE